jgi:outer membrane receptor protein involved in Fe transport
VLDRDLTDDLNEPYFVDTTYASLYEDHFVEVWSLSGDWALERGSHKIEAGFLSQYESVQYLTVNGRSVDSTACGAPENRPLGTQFDLFYAYPNSGSLYLQDVMNYEGFVARVGLRYDYWFPGELVERLLEEGEQIWITPGLHEEFLEDTHGLFGRRFKGYLSPRAGVSYPITQKDHIFFHYGHFTQIPKYYYVYTKSGSRSGIEFPRIGNPNLQPKRSVQYELGMGHQFSEAMAFKATLFNKDLYDYPSAITLDIPTRESGRSSFFSYRNRDYARTRGFELELKKRRTNFWSGSMAYTFSISKGKASDPNSLSLVQEARGDARESRLEETFLWWNRPHKFTTSLSLRIYEDERPPRWLGLPWPRDLSASLYYVIRSGRPYTPETPDEREAGPPYSKNGPHDSTLDFTLRKGFRVGGTRFVLFLQGWNLLNRRTPLEVDPSTGKPWKLGEGQLFGPRYNPDNLDLPDLELLEITGTPVPDELALVPEEAEGIRNSIRSNISQNLNPALFGPPRHFRLGLNWEW